MTELTNEDNRNPQLKAPPGKFAVAVVFISAVMYEGTFHDAQEHGKQFAEYVNEKLKEQGLSAHHKDTIIRRVP